MSVSNAASPSAAFRESGRAATTPAQTSTTARRYTPHRGIMHVGSPAASGEFCCRRTVGTQGIAAPARPFRLSTAVHVAATASRRSGGILQPCALPARRSQPVAHWPWRLHTDAAAVLGSPGSIRQHPSVITHATVIISDSAKHSLAVAQREARDMGSSAVLPQHILLALVSLPGLMSPVVVGATGGDDVHQLSKVSSAASGVGSTPSISTAAHQSDLGTSSITGTAASQGSTGASDTSSAVTISAPAMSTASAVTGHWHHTNNDTSSSTSSTDGSSTTASLSSSVSPDAGGSTAAPTMAASDLDPSTKPQLSAAPVPPALAAPDPALIRMASVLAHNGITAGAIRQAIALLGSNSAGHAGNIGPAGSDGDGSVSASSSGTASSTASSGSGSGSSGTTGVLDMVLPHETRELIHDAMKLSGTQGGWVSGLWECKYKVAAVHAVFTV